MFLLRWDVTKVVWCHGVMTLRCHSVMTLRFHYVIVYWRHFVAVSWCYGVMTLRCHGSTVSRCHGVTASWCHDITVKWRHSVMVLWWHCVYGILLMAALTDVIIQLWVRNDEWELIYENYSIAILCDIKLRYSSYKFVFNLPQYKTVFNGN